MAVIPRIQGVAFGDVGVVVRTVADTGLEIQLQPLHDIERQLEVGTDAPSAIGCRCGFSGLGQCVAPSTLSEIVVTTSRVDRMIGHPKDGFDDRPGRVVPGGAQAAEIPPIPVFQSELRFQSYPLGKVVIVVQPEVVALGAVVRISNDATLVGVRARQVVARIRASAGDREGLLVLESILQDGTSPVGRREEQHPPGAGVERMGNGIRITDAYPLEQVGRVHRRGPGMDIRLIVHERHLIMVGRIHHAFELADAHVAREGELRREARAFLRSDENDPVGGTCAVNRSRSILQHRDGFDIDGIQQVEVAWDAVDQHQGSVAAGSLGV